METIRDEQRNLTAFDRIRWGAVVAGLFATVTTLVVLGILGLAFGLEGFDNGARARHMGVGDGIAGAVTVLIAFAIGGWLAARMADVPSSRGRVLNGVMVWVTAIPLLVYVLGSSVGMASDAVGNASLTSGVSSGETAAGSGSRARTWDERTRNETRGTQDQTGNEAPMGGQPSDQQTGVPYRVAPVAREAAKAAWGTLLAFALGLIAATTGASMATRRIPDRTLREV